MCLPCCGISVGFLLVDTGKFSPDERSTSTSWVVMAIRISLLSISAPPFPLHLESPVLQHLDKCRPKYYWKLHVKEKLQTFCLVCTYMCCGSKTSSLSSVVVSLSGDTLVSDGWSKSDCQCSLCQETPQCLTAGPCQVVNVVSLSGDATVWRLARVRLSLSVL